MAFGVWLSYKGELGQYSWNLVKSWLLDKIQKLQAKQPRLKNPNSLEKKIITDRRNASVLLYKFGLMYEYFWFKGVKLHSL